jgi:hypothetical protein
MGHNRTSLDISVRFLHLLTSKPVEQGQRSPTDRRNDQLWRSGQISNDPWEEGIERQINAYSLSLEALQEQPHCIALAWPALQLDNGSETAVKREQRALTGQITISAERLAGNTESGYYRLRVQIENTTPIEIPGEEQRNTILWQSFLSTHTILHIYQGTFISLLDPPDALQEAARACQNQHTWPVLVGDKGERETILSSPIILYDYPQIAPESPGAFFDGTEIDEMLALRILTLSDEEKAEIRQGDEKVRALLDRAEALSPEQFLALHGTMREKQMLGAFRDYNSNESLYLNKDHKLREIALPSTVRINGREAHPGDRVRLHPRVRADAFDSLLRDKTARIEAIQQDMENRLYVVVTIDDDPGRDQSDERTMPGHRFFFFVEEVELVETQR